MLTAALPSALISLSVSFTHGHGHKHTLLPEPCRPVQHFPWVRVKGNNLCTAGSPSLPSLSPLNEHSHSLIPDKWTQGCLKWGESHLLPATHIHRANANMKKTLMRAVSTS